MFSLRVGSRLTQSVNATLTQRVLTVASASGQTTATTTTTTTANFSVCTRLQNQQQYQRQQYQRQQQQNRRTSTRVVLPFAAAASLSFFSLYNTACAEGEKQAEEQPEDIGFDATSFRPLTLAQITPYNHNTSIFRFELLNTSASLNMPVASFILVKVNIDGKDVIRPYTPVIGQGVGYVDLLVKKYDNGPMSSHIHNLKVGDTLEFKGPLKKIEYKPNMVQHVTMIAGGTGITPMMQVLHHALKNPEDLTEFSLVFANISEKDILMKDWLDFLTTRHNNLKIHYTIDKPSTEWKGDVGHVNEHMLQKYIAPPNTNTLVFVCGPPGFMKHISGDKAPDKSQGELDGLLKKMGYTQEQVYKF